MTIDELIDGIIQREGGFSNRAADRGGPTNHGITRAVYEAFIGRKATIEEIRRMPVAVAKQIYLKHYVTNYQFDQITYVPLQVALVDLTVNAGVDDAARAVQRMPGSQLVADGVMGPRTVAYILRHPNPHALFLQVMRYRYRKHVDVVLADLEDFLATHPRAQAHNLRGWINRCNELLA